MTLCTLAGCITPTSAPPPVVAPSGCAPEAIDAYCAQRECPTFETTANAARRDAKETAAHGGLFRYAIGTCGSYSFVETQTMGISESYYDASGQLVAETALADAPSCGNEFTSFVGTVPKCDLQITERGGTP